VVAVRTGAEAVPHPGEVDIVIRMPVPDFFAGRIGYRTVTRWNSPIFDFDAGSMYGASAHILEELLGLYGAVTGQSMPASSPTDQIPWQ
jgi:hypothetical protein